MVEYTALGIIVLGLLFLLVFIGSTIDKSRAKMKMFLYCSAMWFGVLALNLASKIAEANTAGNDIINTLQYSFNAWVIFCIVFTSYVLIYELWYAAKLATREGADDSE